MKNAYVQQLWLLTFGDLLTLLLCFFIAMIVATNRPPQWSPVENANATNELANSADTQTISSPRESDGISLAPNIQRSSFFDGGAVWLSLKDLESEEGISHLLQPIFTTVQENSSVTFGWCGLRAHQVVQFSRVLEGLFNQQGISSRRIGIEGSEQCALQERAASGMKIKVQ